MKSPLRIVFISLSCFLLSALSEAQTPCENGMAGDYPCNQITLYARVTPDELLAVEHDGFYANDIWGWTDPETAHEYALVGLTDGVSFVDITDPLAPRVLGKLRESLTSAGRLSDVQHGKSAWRDIKVYQNHAFVVSDLNAAHGMQVFDLTRLRSLTGDNPGILQEDALYEGIGSAHNIAINEATGYAYIVGVSSGAEVCGEGGLHILNIQDPKNPEYMACFDDDGYTHDGQCVIYEGPDSRYSSRELCFNANEDTFTIVDVENKEDMKMVSRTGYTQSAYAHQGWLTEDHRFFLMNDELDENAHGFNPRTLIWNVEDLESPQLIGEFFNEAQAIDHNLYVHDGLVYESNYLSGLRVLDLEQVENGKLREVAFFDTYPEADGIHFGGTWSNYPFFASGILAVSDMTEGLFLLKLERQTDPIAAHGLDLNICEEEVATIAPEFKRDDLTYQWQMLTDGRFVDAPENSIYSGTQSATLEVTGDMAIDGRQLRCKVTDADGHHYYTFPVNVAVSPLPEAAFDFELAAGGVLSISNNSVNADSYTWDFGDGTTSSDENPTHTYAETANYTITLTATNSCGDVSVTSETYVITALEEESVVRFYPNPARERIVLHAEDTGLVEIVDISGKMILRKPVTSGNQEISFPQWPAGVYYLSLMSNKGTKTSRLIIR